MRMVKLWAAVAAALCLAAAVPVVAAGERGTDLAVRLGYAGVGRSQRWLAGAIALSFIVALAGFNVANPEAVVVRRNVDHARATGMFDDAYLSASVPADCWFLPAGAGDEGCPHPAR